jgi:hypothetical protein
MSQPDTTEILRKSKKELDINDFKTRSDRLKDMFSANSIPETTDDVVVVKPNHEALGFRYDCYNEEILRDLIPREKFIETVRGASRICENGWMRKRKEESMDFNKNLKRILFISVFLIIVALVMLYVVIYFQPGSSTAIFIVAIILIIIALTLTLFLIVKSFLQAPVFTELEPFIMSELENYFNAENEKNKSLGIQWEIGQNFYWLQLRILEKSKNK